MDIFVEHMVKKKKTAADFLKVFVILAAAVGLVVFLIPFVFIQLIGTFALLLIAGVCYFGFRFITGINVEYEYILTNDEIDVDKIINAGRRKRVSTVDLRAVECFGKKTSAEYERYEKAEGMKKFYACEDKNNEETFFIVYLEADEKKMLFFNPSDKITERIKALNPRKSFVD